MNEIRLDEVRFFADIIRPLEDGKQFAFNVIELRHAENCWDEKDGMWNKKTGWSAYLLLGGMAAKKATAKSENGHNTIPRPPTPPPPPDNENLTEGRETAPRVE